MTLELQFSQEEDLSIVAFDDFVPLVDVGKIGRILVAPNRELIEDIDPPTKRRRYVTLLIVDSKVNCAILDSHLLGTRLRHVHGFRTQRGLELKFFHIGCRLATEVSFALPPETAGDHATLEDHQDFDPYVRIFRGTHQIGNECLQGFQRELLDHVCGSLRVGTRHNDIPLVHHDILKPRLLRPVPLQNHCRTALSRNERHLVFTEFPWKHRTHWKSTILQRGTLMLSFFEPWIEFEPRGDIRNADGEVVALNANGIVNVATVRGVNVHRRHLQKTPLGRRQYFGQFLRPRMWRGALQESGSFRCPVPAGSKNTIELAPRNPPHVVHRFHDHPVILPRIRCFPRHSARNQFGVHGLEQIHRNPPRGQSLRRRALRQEYSHDWHFG